MESTMDITEFFRKLKFVCHWVDSFKDLKWSNVPGVKLSSLFESGDTFSSLQSLSDLYYLFRGFMDYLWSCKLEISNFGLADRINLPMMMDISTPCGETISYNLVRVSILSVALVGMKYADLVRRSTMTQIVSCPLDVLGSFVTKSIVILSYIMSGILVYQYRRWLLAFALTL
ncbi:hypothetical protein Tco_1332751 [Tanacetum coccineum]